MNKKIILVATFLIVSALGIVWFLLKPSQVYISLSSSLDSSHISMQEVKEQVAFITENKLNVACENSKQDVLQCENGSNCKKIATKDVFACNGSYMADNLMQLIRYQNKLFEMAQKNNLNFVGSGGSGGVASLID